MAFTVVGRKVSMYNRMFVFAAAALLAGVAFPCGDKLMLLVGGAGFRQVYSGSRPASILAYAPPTSRIGPVVQELERLPALKEAGHRFYAVQDKAGLEQALTGGKYDLLLADLADAADLEQRFAADRTRPVLVPVVFKPTKTDAAAVKNKFSYVLKAPAKPIDYLEAIDRAVELRRKKSR
jgi:hypothetical protein